MLAKVYSNEYNKTTAEKKKNMHKNTKKCITGRGYKTYGDNYITR